MSAQIFSFTSILTFFLFSSFPTLSFAQSPFIGNPSTTTSAPSSATSGIGSIGYAPDSQNTGSGSTISNYYFIIIGVAIIVVLVATWIIVRRRQRRNSGDDDGTTRNSRGWPMPMPRWRATRVDPRLEEGLNEAGEAPPPYIPGERDPPPPGFEAAATGGPIPLQSLGKPPDYDGHSSEEDLGDLTRPNPTYNPNARFSTRSPQLTRQFSSENTLRPSDTREDDMTEMQAVEPSGPLSGMASDHTTMGETTEMGEARSPGTGEERQPSVVNMESSSGMQVEPPITMPSNRNSRVVRNSIRNSMRSPSPRTPTDTVPHPSASPALHRLSHTDS